MLSQKQVALIAKLLKIKAEDIESAIKDEKEVEIEIDEKLSVFTADELKVLNANKYNDGKKAGVEMSVDEQKKKLGLDFTGKDIDKLIESVQAKAIADAKIEPDQKVKEITEKFTALQKTVGDYETKLKEKESEVENIYTLSEVQKFIPDSFGDKALTKDDAIAMMKANGYDWKKVDGKVVFYKAGAELRDAVQNPLGAKDVVTSFLKEKKLIGEEETVPAGRGGGNRKPPAAYTKLSEIKKKFEEEKKSTLGSEFKAEVDKAVAANKDFDMKS
jgi:hypothetical protein